MPFFKIKKQYPQKVTSTVILAKCIHLSYIRATHATLDFTLNNRDLSETHMITFDYFFLFQKTLLELLEFVERHRF